MSLAKFLSYFNPVPKDISTAYDKEFHRKGSAMSDTPRTQALLDDDYHHDRVSQNAWSALCRELERELAAKNNYAKALRDCVTTAILAISAGGYQGSADKLEDALDMADALDGKGPYAKKIES